MRPMLPTTGSMLPIIGLLAGYVIVTTCLVVTGYFVHGRDLAMLVAIATVSVAVPFGGLLALLAVWLDQRRSHASGTDHDVAVASEGTGAAPLIDRSIIMIGDGRGCFSLEDGSWSLRIHTASGADRSRAPMAGTTAGNAVDRAGADVPSPTRE